MNNKDIEKAVIRSQHCQRNWDLSKQIPEDDKNTILTTTDYSSKIISSVEKENIFGTQFHPEKSDKLGLKIITNFINL